MGWLRQHATTLIRGVSLTRGLGHRRGAGASADGGGSGSTANSLRRDILADASIHARIESALADLKAGSATLEQQFCATCTTLSALSDRGRTLVKGSERLVEIASGKKAGIQVLFEGMALVEPPLAFLAAYRARFEASRLLERLVDDKSSIDECARAESSIERIMEPLRTINTLFKVVAAPLGAHVQAIFESLVEELGDLMNSIGPLVGTKFQDLHRVRQVLHQMIDGMVAQQAHWGELAAQRAAMETTLKELEGQLVSNAKRDTQIGVASRKINAAIEQVVTGLQWQDIISQKLEHASKAITSLLGKLRDPEGPDLAMGAINRAARLEAAQIDTARRELDEAEQAIIGGIGRVREVLSESDSSAVMLGEFELLTTSSTGMVQLLLESIDSIDGQIRSAVKTSSDSMNTIREIGESASALTSAVRELSERTLLVGLNAQVQSCKVQQGAGLGVLSARTSDVSVEVASVGDAVAKKLDMIVGDLAECAEIFASLLSQAETHHATFTAGREAVEQSLHSLRDEALMLVQSTGESIEQIDKIGAEAIGLAHYKQTLDAPFRSLLDLLRTLIDASGGENARFDESDAVLDDAFRSYTMASERKIHAAIGGGEAAAAAVADDPSIELFGDEPSPTSTSDTTSRSGQPSGSDSGTDENVELF